VLALLLVLWALLPWSVRGFVTKLKIGHEVLTAASSFFTYFISPEQIPKPIWFLKEYLHILLRAQKHRSKWGTLSSVINLENVAKITSPKKKTPKIELSFASKNHGIRF
jgi:hypothetical protein